MPSTLRRALVASLLSAATLAVMAQAPVTPAPAERQAPVAVPATPAAPVASGSAAATGAADGPAAAAARSAEPSSSTRIVEDDRVRITETRVRGQLQRITVRSKLTGQDYEIVVGPGGRDPSQNIGQRADSTGQRAWSIFQF